MANSILKHDAHSHFMYTVYLQYTCTFTHNKVKLYWGKVNTFVQKHSYDKQTNFTKKT